MGRGLSASELIEHRYPEDARSRTSADVPATSPPMANGGPGQAKALADGVSRRRFREGIRAVGEDLLMETR